MGELWQRLVCWLLGHACGWSMFSPGEGHMIGCDRCPYHLVSGMNSGHPIDVDLDWKRWRRAERSLWRRATGDGS